MGKVHAESNQKRVGVDILITGKINFKSKKVFNGYRVSVL